MANNLRKNFIWNIIGTTLNAFNSLFFMIIVTRVNGVDIAGIFAFAFATATLFNVIGVYSGRVFQVTDQSKISETDYIMNKIITCSIMLIVSGIFIIINQYNLYKSIIIIILCILKCLEAFAEVIYAIFQKHENLYKAGISLTIKSVLGLVMFAITNILTNNIIFSEVALLISYIFIMIIYDYPNLKKTEYSHKKLNWTQVFEVLKKGFYPFAITFLCLYLVNASKFAIDLNLNNEAQTIFGIIIMPATIILLLGQFIIHPFLTKISDSINNNDKKTLGKIVKGFIMTILFLGLLATICAWVIGIPVLELIYGINLNEYRINLVFILIGASLYGITSIISNILIAMRHNKIQTIILSIFSIITFVVAYFLTNNYGLMGATLTYLIIMGISCIIFVILICYYITKMDKSR